VNVVVKCDANPQQKDEFGDWNKQWGVSVKVTDLVQWYSAHYECGKSHTETNDGSFTHHPQPTHTHTHTPRRGKRLSELSYRPKNQSKTCVFPEGCVCSCAEVGCTAQFCLILNMKNNTLWKHTHTSMNPSNQVVRNANDVFSVRDSYSWDL